MPLEAANFVSGLSPSDPTGPDFVSQGDNHLRLLKIVLQQTFPNADKALRFQTALAIQTVNYFPVFPNDQNKIIPVSALTGAKQVGLPNPTLGGTPNEDGWSVTIMKVDSSPSPVIITGTGAHTVNGFQVSLNFPYQSAICIWDKAAGQWFAILGGLGPDMQQIEGIIGSGVLRKTATDVWSFENLDTTINVSRDNGGVVFPTGFFADIVVDFSCTILGWKLFGNPVGSVQMGITKGDFAAYPPGTSIVASAPPTLVTAIKAESTILTGWTQAIAAGDILRFNINSINTLTYLTLALKVRRFV